MTCVILYQQISSSSRYTSSLSFIKLQICFSSCSQVRYDTKLDVETCSISQGSILPFSAAEMFKYNDILIYTNHCKDAYQIYKHSKLYTKQHWHPSIATSWLFIYTIEYITYIPCIHYIYTIYLSYLYHIYTYDTDTMDGKPYFNITDLCSENLTRRWPGFFTAGSGETPGKMTSIHLEMCGIHPGN